jgi:hypothetical protein
MKTGDIQQMAGFMHGGNNIASLFVTLNLFQGPFLPKRPRLVGRDGS